MKEPEGGKRLYQATVSFWFEGSNPVIDPPDEEFGIMQPTLEQAQAFVSLGLERHWNGECGCQK